MSSFETAWENSRVSRGTRLTVRLERSSLVDWPPNAQQVREKLGASPLVAAEIGSCNWIQPNPVEAVSCGEFHVPVTVLETAVLGDVLPPAVTVASGGGLGAELFSSEQTWNVTGVRFEGITTRAGQRQSEEEQERAPEPDVPDPGGFLSDNWWWIAALALVAFAFTGAGQQLLEAVIPGE